MALVDGVAVDADYCDCDFADDDYCLHGILDYEFVDDDEWSFVGYKAKYVAVVEILLLKKMGEKKKN